MDQVNSRLTAWVLDDPESRVPLILGILGVLLVVPLAIFAVYLYRIASRTIEGRRFPPDGSRLLRAVEPLTGDAATRRGRVIQFAAVLLIASALGLTLILWRLGIVLTRAPG